MPFEHIQSLLLMLHSGGRVLEDIRNIRQDKAIKETLYNKRIPASESIGKWITRHGLQGVYGIETIKPRNHSTTPHRLNSKIQGLNHLFFVSLTK